MGELTQDQVNEVCAELKEQWSRKVEDSGRTEPVFIALDNTGFVSNFMYNYQVVKEHIESLGLIMPEIVKGITVNIKED